jgi:3',5'-cyclic AMP phosphodiesterase CpdA
MDRARRVPALKNNASWFIYAVMSFVKAGPDRDEFTLIHVSDFHLCRPENTPLAAFANKRILSYLSWRIRRRRQHDPGILDALVRAVRAQAADHIVVTGDLTQLALPAECEAAHRCLASLGPPRDVFLVPGNHDALVPAGWDATWSRWSDYMRADEPAPPGRAVLPALRVRGPVALIGLSSAYPTRPFSAAGRIGADPLARCSEWLAEAAQRSLFRIVLIHHPPVPDMVSAHKRLSDADAFDRMVRRHGAELILHGHTHRRSRVYLPGPRKPIPVIGAPSASATSRDPLHCAGFGMFRITRTPAGWAATFQDHGYAPEHQCFVPGTEEPIAHLPPHLVSGTDKTYR